MSKDLKDAKLSVISSLDSVPSVIDVGKQELLYGITDDIVAVRINILL